MRKGFLIVSGCPRSGTSVTMDIQREAHGDEAICGEKFPSHLGRECRQSFMGQV